MYSRNTIWSERSDLPELSDPPLPRGVANRNGPRWQARLPERYGRGFAPLLSDAESEFLVGSLSATDLHIKITNTWSAYKVVSKVLKRLGDRDIPHSFHRNYVTWLDYFIEHNHPFGLVSAWATIVTLEPARFLTEDPAVARNRDRPYFYDSNCDPLDNGSLVPPPRAENGRVVLQGGGSHYVRRVWDLRANAIIPFSWLPSYVTLPEYHYEGRWRVVPVSHAWVSNDEMGPCWTPINRFQWPVPLPKGTSLSEIRDELMQHGIHYTWLDVLCLRQQISQEAGAAVEMQEQEREAREKRRFDEWAVDVPMIGSIYLESEYVVVYFSGLGKAFRPVGSQGERHWLQRAWTLQETKGRESTIFGGLKGWDPNKNPWKEEFDRSGITVGKALRIVTDRLDDTRLDILWELQRRKSTNPRDKIAGAYFLLSSGTQAGVRKDGGAEYWIPTYNPTASLNDAWGHMVHAVTNNYSYSPGINIDDLAFDLVKYFPYPSSEHWFPSWDQLLKHPDVSYQEEQLPHGSPPKEELYLRICTANVFPQVQLKRQRGEEIRPGIYADYYIAVGAGPHGGRVEIRLDSPLITPDQPKVSLPEVQLIPEENYVLVDVTIGQVYDDLGVDACMAYYQWKSHEHLLLICREIEPIQELEPYPYDDLVKNRPRKIYKLRRITSVCWKHGAGMRGQGQVSGIRLPFWTALEKDLVAKVGETHSRELDDLFEGWSIDRPGSGGDVDSPELSGEDEGEWEDVKPLKIGKAKSKLNKRERKFQEIELRHLEVEVFLQ